MTDKTEITALRPGDPESLGPYRTVGRIGRGGMGIVYLAESPQGERAAVKVISPDLADDDGFRDRFRREVESARRVRRFCTAPVLDARLDGEPLYIVTEYVDGPDLDEFVRQNGPMRGSSLEHLAVGVATALTAIHGAGVVHRDLKPANVLLSSVGPRVIDFGIARALDSAAQTTRTGHFIGTPAYMAPELVAGGQASPASDVFAWACVVAYAGTGRPPYSGESVPAVLYQISHGEPDLTGLDDALRGLVTQALSKDPQQRPNAQQVLDHLTGRANADTKMIAEDVSRTWAMRGPAVTRADGPPGTRVLPPVGTRMMTQLRGPRRKRWLAGAGALVLVVAATVAAFALTGSNGPPGKTSSVFSDTFAESGSGWSGGTWTSGSWGYAGGTYRADASDFAMYGAPYKPLAPEHELVSVDAGAAGGPSYGQLGVFCHGNDDKKTGYLFMIRADGHGAVIRKLPEDGGSKDLVTTSSVPGFRAGKVNRVQAACDSTRANGHMASVRLRLWVNKHYVAGAKDSDSPLATWTEGDAGVFAVQGNGGNDKISAVFDNFDISQIR